MTYAPWNRDRYRGPYSYDRIAAGLEAERDAEMNYIGDCDYLNGTGEKICNYGCWEEPQCQTCMPEGGWGPQPIPWEPIR